MGQGFHFGVLLESVHRKTGPNARSQELALVWVSWGIGWFSAFYNIAINILVSVI